MKLSDTQRAILEAAAQHPMGFAKGPARLPTAARNAVFKSLLKQSMVVETRAPRDYIGLGWRQDQDEAWIALQITDAGFHAIGIDPNEGQPGEPDCSGIEGSVPDAAIPANALAIGIEDGEACALLDDGSEVSIAPAQRTSLRDAAATFLAAWDASPAQDATDNPISRAVEGLRAALAEKGTPRATGALRKPREGTKQDAVLALLRRPEGATVAQIADATGWAAHTVRGFFAGLKKKGHAVEAIKRVRMVGPNKEGARGSYTVYQLKTEG